MPNRPTVLRTTRPSAKIVLCNTEKANLLIADSYLLTVDVIQSKCLGGYHREPVDGPPCPGSSCKSQDPPYPKKWPTQSSGRSSSPAPAAPALSQNSRSAACIAMKHLLSRLRKKGDFERNSSPQRLKPDSLHSSYVRPEGRTLRKKRVFPQPVRKPLDLQVFAKKTGATPKAVIATCRERLKEYENAGR
jgi:hypothetical protein